MLPGKPWLRVPDEVLSIPLFFTFQIAPAMNKPIANAATAIIKSTIIRAFHFTVATFLVKRLRSVAALAANADCVPRLAIELRK